MKERRVFSKEFKIKAIELSKTRTNISELAFELGVAPTILYRWRREINEEGMPAFTGVGKARRTPEQQEIHELKKKLKYAEEERDILKKAVGIFSKSGR